MTPINQKDFTDYLARALTANGMSAFAESPALLDSLYALTVRMLEVNEYMNLTTIKEPRDIIIRHYVDSLTAANFGFKLLIDGFYTPEPPADSTLYFAEPPRIE